jgi:hypothetical protein
MWKRFATIFVFACFAVNAFAKSENNSRAVVEAEAIYAELRDANSIIGAIDSGLFAKYAGHDRAGWEQVFKDNQRRLKSALAALPSSGLSANDLRVVALLKTKSEALSAGPVSEGTQPRTCADSQRTDLDYAALRDAMVGCFTELGGSLRFENGTIDRGSALGLLAELDDPARRKALFYSFVPLWQALNGDDGENSAYRRMIVMAAADGAKNGSEIDAAAKTFGVTPVEVEHWLEEILTLWSDVTPADPVEPWDYKYANGTADRLLAAKIPRESLRPLDERFYKDLGVDLNRLGVLYDIFPRTGKSSVAYTDFLTYGHFEHGRWQKTIARVSASYAGGGLSSVNELVHENGHAVHISAIRNRAVFVDWPDDFFTEAFADVSSWSVYEPAWQQKYLGATAPVDVSLRALYGNVMLDVAWSLFELRMLRDPASDPNLVWTDITHRYLHIVPHPEYSWWALRVQLADLPGYMVNYGLGAVLTAELRQKVSKEIGSFDAGNRRWYPYLSDHLLRFGLERPVPELLREFFGQQVSAQALLGQIRRLKVAGSS